MNSTDKKNLLGNESFFFSFKIIGLQSIFRLIHWPKKINLMVGDKIIVSWKSASMFCRRPMVYLTKLSSS